MKEAGHVGLGSRNQELIAITSTIKIRVIFVNNIQLYITCPTYVYYHVIVAIPNYTLHK